MFGYFVIYHHNLDAFALGGRGMILDGHLRLCHPFTLKELRSFILDQRMRPRTSSRPRNHFCPLYMRSISRRLGCALVVTALAWLHLAGVAQGVASAGDEDSAAIRQQFDTVNIAALQRAVRGFMNRYPDDYAHGEAYLEELRSFAHDIESIGDGLDAGSAEARGQAAALLDLQRRILMDNPYIDFDDLIIVRRGVRSNLGLPQNWEGNSSLDRYGWDNEIALMSIREPGAPLRRIYRPENGAFVGDLELHFEADKLMFSMPGDNRRWQIHEIAIDGSNLSEMALIPDDDVDNYEGCYLPSGDVIFSSTAPFIGVPCVRGASHVANLFLYERARGNIRRLTFDQDHNWNPAVMNFGHILYQRWEYSDIPHFASRLLFTMNPDGTNQREYYGSNSYWPNSIFYARPIPGHPTKVVGIVGGHHGVPRMGELVVFDPARGRFEADGVVQRIPGYGEKVEPVFEDYLVDHSWPKFLHPYPLSEKHFIVSAKPTPDAEWGIYLVDIYDNMLLLRAEPDYVLFEPTPLKARPRPPVIPSRVDEDAQTATMFIADIYAGDGLQGVPRGEVKQVRLFTYQFAYHGMGGQVNRVGMDGPWDIKRVLGTVDVEPDGSAMFTVPANTPISIQPLDADGRAMALMRSWATAMPGEVLSCIGCHDSQNTAPPPPAGRMASLRPPQAIKPWFGPTRGFCFEREVQPVLDRYCISCHDGGPDAPKPDLRARAPVQADIGARGYREGSLFSPAYLALRRFVRSPTIESDMHLLPPYEFHAGTTELIQMLDKGHHQVVLSAEAKSRLNTWIDLGTPYHGSWTGMLGDAKVSHQRQRRLEMLKRYAGRSDDEEFVGELQRQLIESFLPEPLATGADPKADVEWGFDADQARRMQAESGLERKVIELADGVEMEYVAIPAGRFVMGDLNGYANESPLSQQTIEAPFWMGKYEVSNEQFAVFDPTHDSRLEHGDFLQFCEPSRGWALNEPRQPVARVSYDQALAFCAWLSEKTGLKVSLPTEVQWEWACRAGTQTPHWYGADSDRFAQYANLADANLEEVLTIDFGLPSGAVPVWRPAISAQDDGFRVSAPVGSYKPNPWGLHDMHGNVSEWTRTIYSESPGPHAAGHDRASMERRVVRGGSWYNRPQRATSSWRWGYQPWQRVYDVGFRVIIEPSGTN